MGAIASESEYGRLCRETLCPVRESRAPPALVRSELEEVVEDLAEEARIKGWTIVCEVTEARDMWDIQACVHWDGKEQESAIQWSSSGMGTGKESGRSMAICIPFSGAETAPSRLVGQRGRRNSVLIIAAERMAEGSDALVADAAGLLVSLANHVRSVVFGGQAISPSKQQNRSRH